MNPSEITSLDFFKFDLDTQAQKFENGERKALALIKLRHNAKAFTIKFTGQISTLGINDKEFTTDSGDKKITYSLGITLDDPTLDAFNNLNEALIAIFAPSHAEFEIIDLVKDTDKVYVKLPIDRTGKNFTLRTNLKISPKNYSDAASATDATFKGELGVYINFQTKKAGLCLSARQLNFDEEDAPPPPPPAKKQKKD